jgi:ABC-type hemin transport system substrate-binding protein
MTPLFSPSSIAILLAVLLSGLLGACERSKMPGSESSSTAPRIVSLSPALTQALIDFDCASHLVGRTPFAPDGVEDVPIVGDLLAPDLERLLVVSPTLLLVQPASSGIDPDLLSLAEARGWRIATWRIDRIADIDRIVEELPALLIEEGVAPEPMHSRVSAWRQRRLELLVPVPAFNDLGSVAVLYGVDPPSVFGQGTYVDDVLGSLGVNNALQRPGYPELSLEDLLVLAPDTVVVLGLDEDLARRLDALDGRTAFVGADGSKLLIPGTGVLDGVESLRTTLLRVVEAPAGGAS